MPSQVHSQLDYTRVLGGRGISTLHGAQGSLILDSPSVDREAKLEAEGEGMWWMGTHRGCLSVPSPPASLGPLGANHQKCERFLKFLKCELRNRSFSVFSKGGVKFYKIALEVKSTLKKKLYRH